MCRGTQKSKSVSVNLDVSCTVRVCIDAHDLNKAICQSMKCKFSMRYSQPWPMPIRSLFSTPRKGFTWTNLLASVSTLQHSGHHMDNIDIYTYHLAFHLLQRNFKYKCMWDMPRSAWCCVEFFCEISLQYLGYSEHIVHLNNENIYMNKVIFHKLWNYFTMF